MARLYTFPSIHVLHHQCTDESQNCIEFRESGVDKGVGEDVVALGYAHNTVGANLTLTNTGQHANQTYGYTDTEAKGAGDSAGGEFTKHQEECYEAVDTLSCGKSREHHVAT